MNRLPYFANSSHSNALLMLLGPGELRILYHCDKSDNRASLLSMEVVRACKHLDTRLDEVIGGKDSLTDKPFVYPMKATLLVTESNSDISGCLSLISAKQTL